MSLSQYIVVAPFVRVPKCQDIVLELLICKYMHVYITYMHVCVYVAGCRACTNTIVGKYNLFFHNA